MLKEKTLQKALYIFDQYQGWLRTNQAIKLGISPRALYALRDSGKIVQESRGIYRLADKEIGENQDLLLVAQRIPKAVIALLSALSFHGLTTQIPHQVYVAIPNHAEKPRLNYPPLHIIWLSDKVYKSGIEKHSIQGIPVQIYSPEKTIADLFKFRNKIGVDIALEALKNYCNSKNFDLNELLHMANINRVGKVILPYLEILL